MEIIHTYANETLCTALVSLIKPIFELGPAVRSSGPFNQSQSRGSRMVVGVLTDGTGVSRGQPTIYAVEKQLVTSYPVVQDFGKRSLRRTTGGLHTWRWKSDTNFDASDELDHS